jgi:opacity protein-like surface antigen
MNKYLVTAIALGVTAGPAAAAANGPYVGIEGGVTFPRSSDQSVVLTNNSASPATSTSYSDGYNVDYKKGWNADAVAGWKLGLLKLEVEGGYQRAPIKGVTANSTVLTDVGNATGTTVTSANLGPDGKVGVKYATANALLDTDFGGGFGGYAGGGYGRAWTTFNGSHDNAAALVGIAGVRYAVTPNVDVGVKYQYLQTGNLDYRNAFTVNNVSYASDASGKYKSHSVLATLAYNFDAPSAAVADAAPPPPPPPPVPEAPATQTCADGSVILATSTCPAPVAPPPPPPAPVSKGQRG